VERLRRRDRGGCFIKSAGITIKIDFKPHV
jgi:hypothetical protein